MADETADTYALANSKFLLAPNPPGASFDVILSVDKDGLWQARVICSRWATREEGRSANGHTDIGAMRNLHHEICCAVHEYHSNNGVKYPPADDDGSSHCSTESISSDDTSDWSYESDDGEVESSVISTSQISQGRETHWNPRRPTPAARGKSSEARDPDSAVVAYNLQARHSLHHPSKGGTTAVDSAVLPALTPPASDTLPDACYKVAVIIFMATDCSMHHLITTIPRPSLFDLLRAAVAHIRKLPLPTVVEEMPAPSLRTSVKRVVIGEEAWDIGGFRGDDMSMIFSMCMERGNAVPYFDIEVKGDTEQPVMTRAYTPCPPPD